MKKKSGKKKIVKSTPILDKVIGISDITNKILEDTIQDYIKSKNQNVRLTKEIYKKWKIGVTNNPDRRYNENLPTGGKVLKNWRCWNAEKKNRALKVEKTFCDKGFDRCQNTNFETDKSIYIYVFIIPIKNRKPKKKK